MAGTELIDFLVPRLQEEAVLFSIPRSLLLNTSNSNLYTLLKPEELATLRNWTGLILVMMWEYLNPQSTWRPYFDIMPTQFDSLMFWTESELAELKGSTIVGKDLLSRPRPAFLTLRQPS